MRKGFLTLVVSIFAFVLFAPAASAQGVKGGPDSATLRDAELEKDSTHNLNVARNYFKLKKAYVAALKRCEEIIAGNPTFSKIDEALYIAGSSSLSLAENKGKQTASLYVIFDGEKKRTLSAEEFRELGRGYLTQLVMDHPESKFRKDAEADLQTVGGPKTKQ